MMEKKEYAGIDYFRIIAAFLVVAIHTSPLSDISETADFILTRVISRVAVPFFFMVSGFFLFSKRQDGKQSFSKLETFIKKTAILYFIAALLYLPLNFYTGVVKDWTYLPNLMKDIVFDGTFYHLWYLPAAIMGGCIVFLLLKKLKSGQAFIFCLFLYIVGLFGDSYYGISESIPFLNAVYQGLFLFSDYTRNGLFFAPIFFMMGALISIWERIMSLKTCLSGLGVSFTLMLTEGLLLRSLNLQRHDSMYIMLIPCMYFLFRSLLLWKGESHKYLRSASMLIYLIHPVIIVAFRGFAKMTELQKLLINNSIIHFMAVAIGSLVVAYVIVKLSNIKLNRQTNSIKKSYRAWAEINMSNLCHNVKVIQEATPDGCRIMAVVKANAYGHGDVPISVELNRNGINAFAVATIDEGVRLRKKGIKGEILILGYTPVARTAELLHYNLSQTIVDVEHAEELNGFGKPIKVHIKVDTGMNRLGENYQHVSEIASMFEYKNLKVTGIFTHLCVSDSIKEKEIVFTNQQIQRFYELLAGLKERHIQIPKIHIQSSYGVLNYPELQCDYARVGIALYGVLSTPEANIKYSLNLQPVLTLKSKVALVRTITVGESIGYSRSFIAQEKMKIAVVSIGYADGVPRNLSMESGHVLIGEKCVPIIGRICMDQLITDITNIPNVKRGDIVTLIGKDGVEEITAEQVAANTGTITNELLSRLSTRLGRIYYY